jgi:hypothetical protein
MKTKVPVDDTGVSETFTSCGRDNVNRPRWVAFPVRFALTVAIGKVSEMVKVPARLPLNGTCPVATGQVHITRIAAAIPPIALVGLNLILPFLL